MFKDSKLYRFNERHSALFQTHKTRGRIFFRLLLITNGDMVSHALSHRPLGRCQPLAMNTCPSWKKSFLHTSRWQEAFITVILQLCFYEARLKTFPAWVWWEQAIVWNTRKYLITKTSVIRYGTNLSLKVYAKQHSNSSLKFYRNPGIKKSGFLNTPRCQKAFYIATMSQPYKLK